jgi:DNA polymerase alpha-associated DNA helicase A
MAPLNVSHFAITQIALLDAELQSEVEETSLLLSNNSPSVLARAGLAITNLTLSSLRTGLGGKTVLELAADAAVGGGELAEHGIRVGDIVAVAEQATGSVRRREARELQDRGRKGVVVKTARAAIAVALDDKDGDGADDHVLTGRLWLVKLANDVTYRR